MGFFWVSQAWETKTWSSYSCLSPLGTAPILIVICLRPRWLMASPLRCGPCSPSLQNGLSLQMLLREAADWPLPVRPGQGQPVPAVLPALGSCLSLQRGLLTWGQRTACVSVFMLLADRRACVFDQEPLHCFERDLPSRSCSYQISDPSECRSAAVELGLRAVLFVFCVVWLLAGWIWCRRQSEKCLGLGARQAGLQVSHESWLLIVFWLYFLFLFF